MNLRRLFLLLVLLAVSCKDPFMPNIPPQQTNLLVVEGYINIGANAVTELRLSRTVPLSEINTPRKEEVGALIVIEDDLGNEFPLAGEDSGTYRSGVLNLPVDRNYRIHITTTDGKSYRSVFITPVETPSIDSVSWQRVFEGVDIYVTTHDPENKTLYYQWEYDEVWERRSPFASIYRYENGGLVLRDGEEIKNMRTCWERALTPDLITASTVTLQNDAITKKLISIPSNTIRLSRGYSIFVKQHALTPIAYSYLQIMKTNTNTLGTFYDPQPSQLYGNMEEIDSSEPVIGYMGAYTTSQVRLNIHRDEVSNWNYDMFCNVQLVSVHPDSLAKYFGPSRNVPLNFPDPFTRDAIDGTHVRCGDCRFWGGDNNKPDFWDETF